MAGSPPLHTCEQSDPVLTARVETVRQLAHGLADPIAMMDREFNVLYANRAARHDQPMETGGVSWPEKCYHLFASRTEICGSCPATQVFGLSHERGLAIETHGADTPCGLQRILPLVDGNGQTASMLALFKRQSKARQHNPGPKPDVSGGRTREKLGELIGKSASMQQLFEMITLVADSSATVLIQGESGTGKELVAKTIHQLSVRCDEPFVVIDCGSLPETLLESELFGHVKGAFTGAVAHKRGLFEEAHGGTIFLDEIADTTPTFQAKLLRVLQEGEIKRVGGNHPIKTNVRVISATNKDLTELVNIKRFRQDLYYRLAVLPLTIPPLRERREDIALLVEHFVRQSCARHGQALRTVPLAVLYGLREAPWPGNVRELQHCIERAVVTTKGPALRCADVVALGLKTAADLRSVSKGAKKHAEKTCIIEALKDSRGNRAEAAKTLKISRAGLYNKLREYGLS